MLSRSDEISMERINQTSLNYQRLYQEVIKIKKWLILPLLIAIIGIYIIWNSSTKSSHIMELYEEKWGMQLPIPEKTEEIWDSGVSFNGDGEWINVFTYKAIPNFQNSGMKLITEENVNEVNDTIQHFIEQTISMYMDDEKTKPLETFDLEAEVGDYYFYQSKNNKYDYFIAVFKIDEQKLYTFEWHQ